MQVTGERARHVLSRLCDWGARHKKAWPLFLILQLFPFSPVYSAFQGFGSTTPGGSRGTVAEVTSLADSGPGTLRDILRKKDHCRIVFKVGGTIRLQRRLSIKEQSFLTIDGSTAPAPGITLEGHSLHIRSSHDIIVTHLKVRHSQADGIMIKGGSHHIVIDHCSVSDAADENISVTEDTHDVTISWCIIGNTQSPLSRAKGLLIANFHGPAVTNVSVHHNLFINLAQRNPQISTAGLFDLRNNVIRDWQAYGIRIRNGAWGNIVNNVLKTESNPQRAILLQPDAGQIYMKGNRGPKGRKINQLSTAPAPFEVAPVSTDAVEVVEKKVLQKAGAFPRDDIDKALIGPIAKKPRKSRPRADEGD